MSKNPVSIIMRGFVVGVFIASPLMGQGTVSTTPCPSVSSRSAAAYKGVYYANDFGYLTDTCRPQGDTRDPIARTTDHLKRIPLGSSVLLDIGGESRFRMHDETNLAGSRLSGLDNHFSLGRLRLYANLEFGAHLRIYAEGVDARIFGTDRPPRNIEVDHTDLLNGFAEFRTTLSRGKALIRAGRQELLFGAQRLVSPLDWGNTRRSFDGIAGGYLIKDLQLSTFAVWPRIVVPHGLDSRDDSQRFAGLYATQGQGSRLQREVYLLNLHENRGTTFDYNLWTLGARAAGVVGTVSWEVEGGYQWGQHTEEGKQRSGFFTAVIGRGLSLPGRPKIEAGLDWARGDRNSADGSRQTFVQLFPLAHAYLGYMDLVARQNILAVNLRATAQPTTKLSLQATVFDFNLDQATDALYNAGGAPIRRDTTGVAGKDVGREIDVQGKYQLTPRVDLMAGVSRFWGGRFIDATNQTGTKSNSSFIFTQLSLRF